ncbi:MAG: hypothetical protein M1531_12260 [Chloroflexi bacterium]|nr:hypothetical protein [Chloroflexota bacterium]
MSVPPTSTPTATSVAVLTNTPTTVGTTAPSSTPTFTPTRLPSSSPTPTEDLSEPPPLLEALSTPTEDSDAPLTLVPTETPDRGHLLPTAAPYLVDTPGPDANPVPSDTVTDEEGDAAPETPQEDSIEMPTEENPSPFGCTPPRLELMDAEPTPTVESILEDIDCRPPIAEYVPNGGQPRLLPPLDQLLASQTGSLGEYYTSLIKRFQPQTAQ